MGNARTSSLVLSGTSQLLVQRDESRKALLIGPGTTNAYTLSWSNDAVAGQGIVIAPTAPATLFARELHGDMVTGPIYVIGTAADIVSYMESN